MVRAEHFSREALVLRCLFVAFTNEKSPHLPGTLINTLVGSARSTPAVDWDYLSGALHAYQWWLAIIKNNFAVTLQYWMYALTMILVVSGRWSRRTENQPCINSAGRVIKNEYFGRLSSAIQRRCFWPPETKISALLKASFIFIRKVWTKPSACGVRCFAESLHQQQIAPEKIFFNES